MVFFFTSYLQFQLLLVLTQLCPGGDQISEVCAHFNTLIIKTSPERSAQHSPQDSCGQQGGEGDKMEETWGLTEGMGGGSESTSALSKASLKPAPGRTLDNVNSAWR